MSTVAARIIHQTNRSTYINYLAAEVDVGIIEGLNLYEVQSRLNTLIKTFNKFEIEHDRLISSKVELPMEEEYFKLDVFHETLKQFVKTEAALNNRIQEIQASKSSTGISLANISLPVGQHSRIQLPAIPLQHFNGDFSTWRTFHDTFVSLVGANETLSNVEKMHYLKSCLKSDAARLVCNMSVSADSFASAWDLLTSRYENKRLLISTNLEKLFTVPNAVLRSAKDLNQILTTATEALNALKALTCPVHHWDQLLVHLLVQKLDSKTRERWEDQLGSSTEFPTYEQYKTFLTSNARALESMENGISSKKFVTKSYSSATFQRKYMHQAPSSRSASQALVHQVQATSNKLQETVIPTAFHPGKSIPDRILQTSSSRKVSSHGGPCSFCNEDHFVVFCAKFRALSSNDRFLWVVKDWLCYNCLGKHNVNKCQVTTVCKECGQKHHTMLHGASFTSQKPYRTSSSTAASQTTPISSTSQQSI